ncbi:MAG: hypothetical protein EOO01_05075 [Chitinophagaceae bacterium]|nr:MAG: hypothetical protein EOO01_05075 [Chitinophagaceae bacterium]
MIVKILQPRLSAGSFGGVSYNTNKVDRDKGELMKVANFGPLQALSQLRPQDYINYLQMISARNKNVRKPQFHVAISSKGKLYDKHTLTDVAEAWLKEMGYGAQPYLIVFHKDTVNNHVHIVSTRVDREGNKIDSGFERRRSQKAMNKILGYDYALAYNFSTRAQFLLLLEIKGYPGRDMNVQQRVEDYKPDKRRIEEINAIFVAMRNERDFIHVLRDKYNIDLVFHAAEGKRPYGYTIIDHEEKNVFKGSEVMPLKVLLNEWVEWKSFSNHENAGGLSGAPQLKGINLSDDVDDEAILGPTRRRKQKSRTNLR